VNTLPYVAEFVTATATLGLSLKAAGSSRTPDTNSSSSVTSYADGEVGAGAGLLGGIASIGVMAFAVTGALGVSSVPISVTLLVAGVALISVLLAHTTASSQPSAPIGTPATTGAQATVAAVTVAGRSQPRLLSHTHAPSAAPVLSLVTATPSEGSAHAA
jgi:hypothetical protein